MIVNLTPLEVQDVQQALKEGADSMRSYINWIDDRPMLPEREKAIAEVTAQIFRFQSLNLKFYEVDRAP